MNRDELLYWLEDQQNVHGWSNAALRRMSTVRLQEELDEREFTAEEIQLIAAIIIDIINKHGGSKEEVFRALYKGYNL